MKYTRNALGLLNAQYRSVLKKCLLINLGLFALGAGVSTANAAVTLSPTLDSLKEQAKDISPDASYTLTRLNYGETLPEGAAKVTINKEAYYFTPKSDKDLLQTLAGTSAGVITDGTPKSISFDVSKLPASVFKYETDTKNDNIDLKPNEIGTSKAIKWNIKSDGAIGSVEVKLPNSDTQTLYYTVDSGNYTLGTRLNDLTHNVGSAKKVLFKGLHDSSEVKGGAIYNTSTDGYNIYADFIGNYASSGGAIYNSGTLGNITGDFIGNYASSSVIDFGGAIYNNGTIGNITGDFIGNYASATGGVSGGAIYNGFGSTIGNITGDFIGNYASAKRTTKGGAIYNMYNDTIGNITGDFIGNYASSEDFTAEGGAIYNGVGTIGNITGDFIGNYAASEKREAQGGVIYNDENSTIGNITGDFIGNYASVNSESETAQGGAIYNHYNSTIGNISGDFIGNYASSESGEAQGGAVYNNGTITIAGASTFTDNYVEVNGKKTSNAIHNEGTVNFEGTNIVVNDAITGENGTINIASSSNGMTTFNNSVSGNTINLNQGTLKLGHYTSEKFGDSVGSFADDVDFVASGGVLNLGDQKVSLKSAEFNDGSTLAINIKSDGNGLLKADSLKVNGGQLKASLGQGIVDMQNKQKIVTLLESGTEFTNNFADVADNNMYIFEKADKAGDYIISLAKTAEDVSQENGGTQNNAGEAKAWVDGNKFEQGSVSADVADKLADLAQNDAKGFNEALSALAPSDNSEVRINSISHNTEMFRAVVSHLDDVSKKSQYGLSSGDVVDGVSVWAKAFGNHAKVDNTSKAYGFKSDGYGATLGIEKQLNNAFKVGLGYSYFYNDVDGFMRDSDVNTHTGFVYGEYRPNDWYTNAIASYGYSEYDENKHVAGDVYKAKYDVDNIGAQVMTGYNASVAKVDVTPETGLRYNNIHRDNYVDSAGQAVKAETMDVLTAVAGLKVGKDLVSCFGLHEVYWRPEARLAATYDLISDKENAVVSLSNGSGYVVKGQRLNRFGVEAGAGVTFYLSPDVESSVGYEGKFRSHYQDHTGYVSAKYKF